MSLVLKNQQISINHRDLKNEYFFLNFQIPSFYINEHLRKRKTEIKIFKHFILGPQNGQIGFSLGQRNNKKCVFFFFFCF